MTADPFSLSLRPRDLRRPCGWCGCRRDRHADLGAEAALLGPGICPTWVPPPPWPVRVLVALGGPAPTRVRRR